MKKGHIDVLMPTQGIRFEGLVYQIVAILNQKHRALTLWVLVDTEDDSILHDIEDIVRRVPSPKIQIVRVPSEWGGHWGHRPIKYAIEHLPLEGEWVFMTGDDDCIPVWSLDGLMAASEGVDMVCGLCIGLTRNQEYTGEVWGQDLAINKATGSCCMYRLETVKELGYSDDRYAADWDLIERFLTAGKPYRKINKVISIMPSGPYNQ